MLSKKRKILRSTEKYWDSNARSKKRILLLTTLGAGGDLLPEKVAGGEVGEAIPARIWGGNSEWGFHQRWRVAVLWICSKNSDFCCCSTMAFLIPLLFNLYLKDLTSSVSKILSQYIAIFSFPKCVSVSWCSSVSKTYPSTLSCLVFPNLSWFSSVSGTQYSCSHFGNNQTSQKVTSPYERLNTLSNTWQRSCCTGFPCFDWLVVCFFSYERLNSYLATILSHWVPLPQPGPPSTQTMGRPEAVRAEQSTGYEEFSLKASMKPTILVYNSWQQ